MRIERSWWWEIFFMVLAATGNVSRAAREAGQRRTAVYELAKLNPDFRALWIAAVLTYDEAKQEQLVEEKRRRMARARFNLGLE